MNCNQIGAISEAKVLLWCMQHNITVSNPYGDKARYDQIWDVNNKLIRIQIKTAKIADDVGEVISFNCYSVVNGKKHIYSKNEIDYFAIAYEDEVYLIPVEECSVSKKLRIADSKNTAKFANKVNWAKDYLGEEVLKQL